jgi:hypothetical protein
MALSLYLDDCAYAITLMELLRRAGHHVVVPVEAGRRGASDAQHLDFARSTGKILVTKNPADFQALHAENPHHPGIFLVCQDNDPDRDMSYREIVDAIDFLEDTFANSGTTLANQVHILNMWRRSGTGAPASRNEKEHSELPPPQAPERREAETHETPPTKRRTRRNRKKRP